MTASNTKRKSIAILAATLLIGSFGVDLVSAQDRSAFLQQQRRIEEEVRQELDQDLPAYQKVDIDYGGWYSFYLFLWDDGIESSRTFRRHDVRAWSSLSLDQGAHEFYVRGKLQFEGFNSGDSYDGNDDDWVGPEVDRGFYQFDLQRAAQAYGNENLDWNFKLKIGRDYVDFGTGYALSAEMDHLLLTLDVADFEVQGLMGMAVENRYDIDQSRPGSGSTDRNFWGFQIKYRGLEKHEPFFYGFWQDDQSEEAFPVLLQDFDYETWYLGIGSRGEVVTDLRYSTEWVFEGGESYGNLDFIETDNVCAWAFDFRLDYLPKWPLKPKFVGEYMFASGDNDRLGSPTNAFGGNTAGNDSSFSGFGYRDTGLAFAPRLSNIHIWRAGGSITPLERLEWAETVELGTDWFLYAKNHADAAVSDFTADQQSGYLGWEMDYYVNWRITSDLAWTTRFGAFFPGQAFSDRTTRTFFLTGVTWSF